jgi:plastocyanin
MQTNRLAVLSLAVVVAAGCGKKTEPPQETPARDVAGHAAAPAVPEGPTVALSGAIHFDGTPPERKPMKMTADDNCHKQHPEPVLSEDVIVGAGGALRNVLVSVTGGLEGRQFSPPADAVVLDQKGCVYAPHVFGVMANQNVRILNSDPTLHNVHGIPESGDGEFNVGMPRQGMEITRTFKQPVLMRFKCDVHPWMVSYGHVMPHPYYAVSGDDGTYRIPNLPAGRYTIQAWHEKLGTQTATVTVGEAGATTHTLDFTFKPSGS